MTQDRNELQPASPTGPQYWQSLEQLAGGEQIDRLVSQEFTSYDPKLMTGSSSGGNVSRRRFMQLAAASMALSGLTLTGCRRWPKAIIAPFTAAPKGTMPGEPQYYASVAEFGGIGRGAVVQGIDGRPIKVEGNPLHPMSVTTDPKIGAIDFYAYGSTLGLYDPERGKSPMRFSPTGENSPPGIENLSWKQFIDTMLIGGMLGGRVAVLSEAMNGPTMSDMRRRFGERVGNLSWFTWEAVHRDNEIAGLEEALGQRVRPQFKLDAADRVVSFDCDLLREHPAAVRHQADWAKRRKVDDATESMSRVYVVESTYTQTGATADYRLPADPHEIITVLMELASRLDVGSGHNSRVPDGRLKDLAVIAYNELTAAGPKGLIVVGPHLPARCHAVAAAINAKIGAVGTTVSYIEEPQEPVIPQITECVRGMNAGEFDTLLILGGNPSYDAPGDLDFVAAMRKVNTRIHLAESVNETSVGCNYYVPKAHWLESWGDARAWDGTLSVRQPLILPLFDGKTPEELLSMLLEEDKSVSRDLVRRAWEPMLGDSNGVLDAAWRRVLHDGLMEGSAAASVDVSPSGSTSLAVETPARGNGTFTVTVRPCPKVYDGRFANNGWLQENPHPMTLVAWDNVAAISKHDAGAMGVENNDVLSFGVEGRSCLSTVFILPGQPRGVIGLTMGYGRAIGGKLGTNVGHNVFPLTSTQTFGMIGNVQVTRAGQSHRLAVTQMHHLLDNVADTAVRHRVGERFTPGTIIREASLDEFRADKRSPHRGNHAVMSLQLYDAPFKSPPKRVDGPEFYNHPHAWGMAIDMNVCTGCNACVIACTSENNLPVVGKDQVLMNREMQWIRIDRYFKGSVENPDIVNQPVMCVHCENAPCEQVCPVAATVHDTEGLNTMVYNRCIGTRYCSNNCPYKVRRFNYFDYHSKSPVEHYMPWIGFPDSQQQASVDKVHAMVYNPEVTVRMRGVMEKCTYCTQRIKAATIHRRNEWAQGSRSEPTVDDGDIITACQQACPTQAIVFGNLNDPNAKVTVTQSSPRTYDLLGDLNTRPRGKHLARIRNRDEDTSLRLLASAGEKVHGSKGEAH